ncbi:hypothetical protein OEZ86_003762 [Tetradesmus obliquus]|nr:hypothetical protein OEZ86_003762 [Tetradesmus obliquus]
MAGSAVASKLKRPRSVTPSTLLGWLQLAGSAVFLSYHSVAAWLTVLLGRLRGKHPLSHPEWPLDLALISAGFRVCMEKGCMVDFRPLLSGLSLLQFYPGLRLQRVNAGGCKAYWMRLRGGKEVQHAQVVLFYVHGGAFVGGDACMTAWTFQHWMQRLTGSGLHAAVLSVEYPLAPERRFPAAVVDTAAAYTWLRQQLQQQGSSACIIPVADSAGANILVAALTALRDISSGSSMDELLQGAVAQTAAAERKQACFYDEEWRAQHEPRFDYLPVSVVGGGMHHYVGSTALLACGYVSPLHAASLAGLAGGPWLVLAGGAELMARDIDSVAA